MTIETKTARLSGCVTGTSLTAGLLSLAGAAQRGTLCRQTATAWVCSAGAPVDVRRTQRVSRVGAEHGGNVPRLIGGPPDGTAPRFRLAWALPQPPLRWAITWSARRPVSSCR